MSKTLIIKYFYKGKLLSIKFSDGDRIKSYLINKKIVIGSDPTLFWQVYNTNFPKKFDLVVKEKDSYFINLLKSFSIEVKKDGIDLDLNDLKAQGLLKDNRLSLRQDICGKITLDNDSYYTFEYESINKEYSPDEKRDLLLFNTKPKATREQKQARYSVIGVVLLVAILYAFIGWDYNPPKKLSKFEQIELEVQTSLNLGPEDQTDSNVDVLSARDMINSDNVITDSEEKPIDNAQAQKDVEREQRRQNLKASGLPQVSVNFSRESALARGNSAGGPSTDVGSGSVLSLKATLSGLGGAKRDLGFSNVESNTGSSLSEVSQRYKSNRAALGSSMVSDSGVSSSEIGSREVGKLSADGTANLASVTANLGDGNASIDELQASGGDLTDIQQQDAKKIQVKKIVYTNAQKELQFEQWYNSVIRAQVDNKVREFKQKKPITGELTMTFTFEKDVVKDVRIIGVGSANDREFINILRRMLRNQICTNIGDYRIDKKHRIM